MEIYSSKLNWLIHIKKLFQKQHMLDVSEFISSLKGECI